MTSGPGPTSRPNSLFLVGEVDRILKWAATETYPKECAGFLIGEMIGRANLFAVVHGAIPFQMVLKRTKGEVNVGPGLEAAKDFWEDRWIGEFHSHPSDHPTLSKDLRIRDDDFESMEIGAVELIYSIWPSKRPDNWCFRRRAYVKLSDTLHRRLPIRVY